MIKVLVCGSVSYDTITLFRDRFSNSIVPDQERFPDLAFHVSEMRNEYGGCAVNICYNLKMLNCNAAPVAAVGDDFNDYQEHLESCDISLDYIKHINDTKTAHYFITVDEDENQIVVFHAGAMDHSHENNINHPEEIVLGVISPDAIKGMKLHAQQFSQKKIPFIFDPGPITRLLSAEDLEHFVQQANWVIMNNHEWDLLQEKIKLTKEDIVNQVEALIITDGSNGSKIFTRGNTFSVLAANVSAVKDPTGCGDAYRAGIIHGILNELDWQITGQIATVMGAICAEHGGAQNHKFTMDEFCARYENNYGVQLDSSQ
jgi:adenosine kinase